MEALRFLGRHVRPEQLVLLARSNQATRTSFLHGEIMAHEELTKQTMRVEFIKAIITGTLGHESPYINYAEPGKAIAKKAWGIADALAEMEMKKREGDGDAEDV